MTALISISQICHNLYNQTSFFYAFKLFPTFCCNESFCKKLHYNSVFMHIFINLLEINSYNGISGLKCMHTFKVCWIHIYHDFSMELRTKVQASRDIFKRGRNVAMFLFCFLMIILASPNLLSSPSHFFCFFHSLAVSAFALC